MLTGAVGAAMTGGNIGEALLEGGMGGAIGAYSSYKQQKMQEAANRDKAQNAMAENYRKNNENAMYDYKRANFEKGLMTPVGSVIGETTAGMSRNYSDKGGYYSQSEENAAVIARGKHIEDPSMSVTSVIQENYTDKRGDPGMRGYEIIELRKSDGTTEKIIVKDVKWIELHKGDKPDYEFPTWPGEGKLRQVDATPKGFTLEYDNPKESDIFMHIDRYTTSEGCFVLPATEAGYQFEKDVNNSFYFNTTINTTHHVMDSRQWYEKLVRPLPYKPDLR